MAGIVARGPQGYGQSPAFNTLLNQAGTPGVTTQGQNQWDWWNSGGWKAQQGGGMGALVKNPIGPRPIDEGAVAWERELEANRILQQRDREAAAVAEAGAANSADRARTQGRDDAAFNYSLQTRAADDNQRRMMDVLANFGGGAGGSAVGAPTITGGDAGVEGARAAAIGRAKDESALAVGAARRSMLGNMATRGISGSGLEAKADRSIQLAGAGQLGAASRQLAEGTAERAQSVADRNYQGRIVQRGQDMSAATSRAALLPSLLSLFRVSASY